MVDLPGTELSQEDREILVHPKVAGVLLFSRNFTGKEQLIQLVNSIRSVRENLLITVDQEGGLVQRFKTEFTRLPPAASYARYYNRDPENALALTKDAGWLMASELLACDIDLSLAPVLDLDLGLNTVIGTRAFGHDTETVIQLTEAWRAGVNEAGMANIGKHFPGHGSVDLDSHLDLPVDSRSWQDIENRDLKPFVTAIESGIEALMPAHIVFDQVDSSPTGFSKKWLQDILRKQLGFKGLVMSDCLTMEGAASAGSYSERVRRALSAGCNLLILSNRDGVKEVLSEITDYQADPELIQTLMKKQAVDGNQLRSSERYLNCRDKIDHLIQRYTD
nr:beta-N-acetylhexosaminidase [Endozoicomonas sp. OPT23]